MHRKSYFKETTDKIEFQDWLQKFAESKEIATLQVSHSTMVNPGTNQILYSAVIIAFYKK